MSTTRTILSTTAFWLLCFSFGTLYMLFTCMEIRLPAGNMPKQETSYSSHDRSQLESKYRDLFNNM